MSFLHISTTTICSNLNSIDRLQNAWLRLDTLITTLTELNLSPIKKSLGGAAIAQSPRVRVPSTPSTLFFKKKEKFSRKFMSTQNSPLLCSVGASFDTLLATFCERRWPAVDEDDVNDVWSNFDVDCFPRPDSGDAGSTPTLCPALRRIRLMEDIDGMVDASQICGQCCKINFMKEI